MLFIALFGLGGLSGCLGDGSGNADESSVEQEIAPPPPSGLVVTVLSATAVSLQWNAVIGATSYIVLKGTAPGNETTLTSISGASPKFGDGHDLPGGTYCYEVKVYIAGAGVSGPSNEQCVMTPTNTLVTPTNVTATATSTSRINVAWTGSPGATKYYVFQSTNGGTFTLVNSVTTTSYVAAALTTNTNYCYEIQASSTQGTSAVSSPPACDRTFGASLEAWYKLDEDMGLTAADSSGNNHTGTLVGAAAFSNDKAPIANNLSTVLSPGATTDSISVPFSSVFNLSSDFSVALWVKLPAAPTGKVTLLGERAAGCGALTWEIAQDATNGLYINGATLRGFNQSLPVGIWTHVAVTKLSGNASLYLNGTLVTTGTFTAGASTSAPFQIGTAGSCGNGGAVIVDDVRILSRAMTTAEIVDIGKQPPAPANLVVVVNNSTQMSLSWTASTNPTKYIILKGSAPGNETFYTSSPPASPTFGAGHLTPGTQYSWQVTQVEHGLISKPSNEQVASTAAAPTAPTGVMANAVSKAQINVSWTAVTGATKYFVYQSTSGGPYVFKGSALSPATTLGAAGLTTMTTYSYEVAAQDGGGSVSPMSTPASATTL
ncbi:MAG: cell wall-binding protein [Myxococcales bacterium]|nr:cell wall-binding protein [Myxococcales bacterium]